MKKTRKNPNTAFSSRWRPREELWLDVRIHTVNPNVPVARELLREEQTKCRQRMAKNTSTTWLSLRGHDPSGFGTTGPHGLIQHCSQHLVRQPSQLKAVGPTGLHPAQSAVVIFGKIPAYTARGQAAKQPPPG